MVRRRIHPTFNVSLLRPFVENDEKAFPGREPTRYYDVGIPEDHEWVVDSILDHRWMEGKIEFKVRWVLGDTTWEDHETCEPLEALDAYLALMGAGDVNQLSKPDVVKVSKPKATRSGGAGRRKPAKRKK